MPGSRCGEAIHPANARGGPVKSIGGDRNAAPAGINAVMLEVRAAPVRPSMSMHHVRGPFCARAPGCRRAVDRREPVAMEEMGPNSGREGFRE